MSAEPVSSAPDTNEASLWDDEGVSTSESASDQGQPEQTASEPGSAAPTDGRQRDERGRFVGTAQAQPGGQPSAEAPTAPPAKTFSVLDRQFSQEDLLRIAEQGDLDRWARTAQQFPYLQQQYLTQKQELEALRQQAQAAPRQSQGAQQGIQVTPQAIQAYYLPQANKLVEQGAIEREAVELFPGAITRMMFLDDLRQQTEQRAAMAEQRVSQMEQYLNGLYQGQQAQSAHETVSRHMQAVAARGDLWGELADGNVQAEFLDYLVNKINPPMDMVDENLIAQQFAAYRSGQLVEAARALKAAQAAQQAQSIQRAVGEGSGSRPATPAKSDMREELDEMFNDY